MDQLDDQTDHLNDEAEVEEINPNSSLLALASLSAKILKDIDQMDIPKSEVPLPTFHLNPPSTEIIPRWDFNYFLEPLTPSQPTLEQLTSELTQSAKQNEAHVKLISELREENRELQLQIKNMEDLHKTISISQRDRQVRHALLKAQVRKLKYKKSVPSKSEVAADTTLPPSS